MEKQELEKQVREKAQKWLNPAFDKETREQVQHLLDKDVNELIESFYRAIWSLELAAYVE
jgi:hypothetical protein